MTAEQLVERWRRVFNYGPEVLEEDIVAAIDELAYRSYLRGDFRAYRS